MTRRDLVEALMFGAACAACGPLLDGCAALTGPPRLRLAPEADGVLHVPLDGLDPGPGAVHYLFVEPQGPHLLAVMDADAGRWRVLSRRCTHAGGLVRWSVGQRRLICPKHGSEFARDGSVLMGPAVRPLTEYPVTAEPGKLRVQI